MTPEDQSHEGCSLEGRVSSGHAGREAPPSPVVCIQPCVCPCRPGPTGAHFLYCETSSSAAASRPGSAGEGEPSSELK